MLRSTKFNLNSKLLVKPFYSKVYNIVNIFFYQQNITSGNKIWKTNQCLMQHVVNGMQLPRGVSLSSLILRPFNATNVRRPDVGI